MGLFISSVVVVVVVVVVGVFSWLGGPSQLEIINKRASTSAEVTVNSQRVLISIQVNAYWHE